MCIDKSERKREESMFIYVEDGAKMPRYEHDDDSGMDLFANEDEVINPGEIKLISTGVRIALPKGYEAQIRPKSGLALKHGITVLNTPGTIDAGYRGEIKVILINLGNNAYKIEKGKKIAQMVISKVEYLNMKVVNNKDELPSAERGEGGFGSTGL